MHTDAFCKLPKRFFSAVMADFSGVLLCERLEWKVV